MLRTTEMKAAVLNRISPRFVLLAVLSGLVLLAAMAPASATAGGPSGTPGDCVARVTSTQDPAVASISVDCGDGNNITSVDLSTSEDGSVEGNTGTTCSNEQSARNFTCSPEDSDFLITARLDADSGDVCASPRLTVDFSVDLEDGSTEAIDNVVVANCSDSSGGGGSGGDEDDGSTPEGGVDSGAGGTAKPSAASGATLPLTGAALTVLALASAGLAIRKSRTTP